MLPFIMKNENGTYPFANGLNGLAYLWILSILKGSIRMFNPPVKKILSYTERFILKYKEEIFLSTEKFFSSWSHFLQKRLNFRAGRGVYIIRKASAFLCKSSQPIQR
jgi:hypothetical protein